jgi:hypothetical protein
MVQPAYPGPHPADDGADVDGVCNIVLDLAPQRLGRSDVTTLRELYSDLQSSVTSYPRPETTLRRTIFWSRDERDRAMGRLGMQIPRVVLSLAVHPNTEVVRAVAAAEWAYRERRSSDYRSWRTRLTTHSFRVDVGERQFVREASIMVRSAIGYLSRRIVASEFDILGARDLRAATGRHK